MDITTISTITPVYKGEAYLETLINELNALKLSLEKKTSKIILLESIFVVDGAKDGSLAVLNEQKKKFKWIKVIVLSKNFGQHPATAAGILHSSGDWVVSLDEDLQHPPRQIPKMLQKCLQNSDDICYASPIKLVHNSIIKDKLSQLFKSCLAFITSNQFIKMFNSYRLMRGPIARATASISRHETYFDIALNWFTERVCMLKLELIDERNASKSGNSGYSFRGLLQHSKRMILTSKIKVLRSGILIGLFAFFVSIIVGSLTIAARLFDYSLIGIKGWSSLMITILFFGGLVSLMVGIILETTSDIIIDIKGKPTFFTIDRDNDGPLLQELNNIIQDEDL